jgi:hypothetical protein
MSLAALEVEALATRAFAAMFSLFHRPDGRGPSPHIWSRRVGSARGRGHRDRIWRSLCDTNFQFPKCLSSVVSNNGLVVEEDDGNPELLKVTFPELNGVQFTGPRGGAVLPLAQAIFQAIEELYHPQDYAPSEEPMSPEEKPAPPVEGVKYDQDKLTYTLLPPNALEAVVRVLMYGANKYPSADNWRKVPNARTRYLNAALRHIWAAVRGEHLDPESGLPHLAHAATSLLFVLELHNDEDKP